MATENEPLSEPEWWAVVQNTAISLLRTNVGTRSKKKSLSDIHIIHIHIKKKYTQTRMYIKYTILLYYYNGILVTTRFPHFTILQSSQSLSPIKNGFRFNGHPLRCCDNDTNKCQIITVLVLGNTERFKNSA